LTSNDGSILRAENLKKVYRGRAVVDGVDLELRQGEIVGLLGPNGAGKTTSFYMIVGFITPGAGKVYLDDRDISRLPMYKRARLGIGYLPQESSIFRQLSVEDNVMAVLQSRGLSRKERHHRQDELLDKMSVTHIRKNKGYELSGGERRRVEIARALVTEPKFMLLDEPFAALDPLIRSGLHESMLEIFRDLKKTVLMVSHDLHEAAYLGDEIVLLNNGKIIQSGSINSLVNNPTQKFVTDFIRAQRSHLPEMD